MEYAYIGMITPVAFNFAPRYWAHCNGQLLSIAQNSALFSILGTTYGGDGVTTFGLPNLQSRAALHKNSTYPLGAMGGVENVTLLQSQIPPHTHLPRAFSAAGSVVSPAGNVWAGSDGNDLQYDAATASNTVMSPFAIGAGGGGQAHDNVPPVQVLNFCICLYGQFPPRN